MLVLTGALYGRHELTVQGASRKRQLEALFDRRGSTPAIAFALGDRVVKGLLESPEDICVIQTLTNKDRGHGFRIGPGEGKFSIGVVDRNGTFVSPEQQYFEVVNFDEPLYDTAAGDPSGAFEQLRFS